MVKALVLLATGFEEMEAVIVIDVLRRASVEVTTAALGELVVEGSHTIPVLADTKLDDLGAATYDVVVLPGGQPGSQRLRDDARVQSLLRQQHAEGRMVAAICAAPSALEAAGLLHGRKATSFPGVALPSAEYSEARVVVDGTLVTSRGPGTTFEFALTLVDLLVSASVAEKLRQGMLVNVPV